MLEHLKDSVTKLSEENVELARANLGLRQELSGLLQKVGLPSSLPDNLLSNLALQSILSQTGATAAFAAVGGDHQPQAIAANSGGVSKRNDPEPTSPHHSHKRARHS